jgi:uncharacterized oligopeptide transporter (OPT) family protein
VATGGIISMIRTLPLIFTSLLSGLRDMRAAKIEGSDRAIKRTERDMPMSFVFFGSLAMIFVVWLFLGLAPENGSGSAMGSIFNFTNLLAAILIVFFGFLFVTVSSRLTGEIGSSSNPISGMTVATLLLTCLIFFVLGWTSYSDRLVALSIAAVVCIASSNGGTTSQDLKTGYLIGATPKYQQWSILVGSISSALVIGVILLVLNYAGTVYTKKNLPTPKTPIDVSQLHREKICPEDGKTYRAWQAVEGNPQDVPQGLYLVDDAGQIRYLVDPGINGKIDKRDNDVKVQKYTSPQARLFALITDGILNQKLPWTLVLLGVAVSVVMELCGLPSLAFAVGVYLPLSSTAPVFLGGLARYFVDKFRKKSVSEPVADEASDMSPGVLFSTGYIAGGSLAGVLVGFLSLSDRVVERLGSLFTVPQYDAIAIAAFALLAVVLTYFGLKKSDIE